MFSFIELAAAKCEDTENNDRMRVEIILQKRKKELKGKITQNKSELCILSPCATRTTLIYLSIIL